MKKLTIILISLLMFMISSLVWSEPEDHKIRFGLQYISPMGDLTTEGVKFEAQSDIGFSFGYEYMATDLVGIDANLSYSEHDVDASYMGLTLTVADATMTPLTVGVNFHVVSNENLDFYLGPFAAYVMYGDLKSKIPGIGDASIDDDFGFGAVLGIDVPFGSKGWMFSSALKYLQTSAEPEGDEALDIDPLVIQLGVGYKF